MGSGIQTSHLLSSLVNPNPTFMGGQIQKHMLWHRPKQHACMGRLPCDSCGPWRGVPLGTHQGPFLEHWRGPFLPLSALPGRWRGLQIRKREYGTQMHAWASVKTTNQVWGHVPIRPANGLMACLTIGYQSQISKKRFLCVKLWPIA